MKTRKEKGLLVGAVTKIVHGQVERDSVVSIRVQRLLIIRNKIEIIVEIEAVDVGCRRVVQRGIVHQISGGVPVETIRNRVEQILE